MFTNVRMPGGFFPRAASGSIRQGLSFMALIVAAGCVTGGGVPAEQGRDQVVIEVRNDNFNRATVYTSEEFGSRRLGFVGGKSKATFRLEWHLPQFQLRIKFLAGGEILSQRWTVGSGETWQFIIPATCC